MTSLPDGIEIRGEIAPGFDQILTRDALALVAKLQRELGQRRIECLNRRQERQARLDAGESLDFLSKTKHIRDADWTCASIPADLCDRRVEITGPTDRKMVINALNSGAKMFMADFEDANSPTWPNMMEGQINLRDAIRRVISFNSPEGKEYKLGQQLSTFSTTRASYSIAGAAHIFISRKWRAISRRGFGTMPSISRRTSWEFRAAAFAPPCSLKPFRPRLRWTKSFMNCATILPG